MIPIVLGAKKYGLTFEHRHIPVLTEGKCLGNKITLAKVYEVDDGTGQANPFAAAEGQTLCSFKDQFCKETGRKLALTRLLKAWGLGKEAREKVWEQYRNRGKV